MSLAERRGNRDIFWVSLESSTRLTLSTRIDNYSRLSQLLGINKAGFVPTMGVQLQMVGGSFCGTFLDTEPKKYEIMCYVILGISRSSWVDG